MKDCGHIFCKDCMINYMKCIKNSESIICPFPDCNWDYGDHRKYKNQLGDIVSPPWVPFKLPEKHDIYSHIKLVEVKPNTEITKEEFDFILDKELSTKNRNLTVDDKTAIWNIFTCDQYKYKRNWKLFEEDYIPRIKNTIKNALELWEDPEQFIYGFLNTKTAEESKFIIIKL